MNNEKKGATLLASPPLITHYELRIYFFFRQ